MVQMPKKPDLSIIGQKYNMLTVLELSDKRNSYGRQLYKCRCDCGNIKYATRANLLRDEIKNCGCVYRQPKKDLTGMRFGRLIAIEPTKSNKTTLTIWRCKCDCGKETFVRSHDLIAGNTKSCGCLQRDKVRELYINGTAPSKLKSQKPRSTNTSGVTGVWYDESRGKWTAEIMFQRRKYFLGRFDEKNNAVTARKEAEEHIYGPFLEWYKKIHFEQWERLERTRRNPK